MKTKRNTASKVPDILIVLICLTGIAVSLWMFWKDLNATLTKQSETPIAEIEFKRKSAQRKFLDSVVWDRLQQRSLVYSGDTIRTADLSMAVITFAGSSDTIQLSDSSIIQIFRDEAGKTKVDISGGNIEIDKQDSGGSLTLLKGNNEITVQSGSRINIQSDAESEYINLTIMQGSASLSSEQGTVTMNEGSALKVSGDGTTESFVTIVDIIAYPDSYRPEISSTHIPVQFIWNTANMSEDEAVRLEIAKERSFSAVQQSADISGGNNTILTMDSAGTYYWRIYPAGIEQNADTIENASTGKFDLAYAQVPQLVSPADAFIYSYRTKKPAVRMYWASGNQDASYKLEIADNPQMTNPEIMLLQESFVTYSALDSGDWYWRVTPVFSNNFLVNAAQSKIGHFRIEQEEELQAPKLQVPLSEAVINIAEEDSSEYFSWKHDPEAVSYTIQISRSSNLENPIVSNHVTNNFFAYSVNQHTLPAGQYFWAVYGTDNEGNRSPLSDVRLFRAEEAAVVIVEAAEEVAEVEIPEEEIAAAEVVEIPAEKAAEEVAAEAIKPIEYATIFPPDNYSVAASRLQDTEFTWQSSLPVPNRFQISANRNFSDLIIDVTTNDSRRRISSLPAGNYYWRIVAEQDGNAPPLSTAPKILRVIGPLGAARMIYPDPGASMVLRPGTNINFSWEAVAEADYYQFKLFRGNRQLFENLSVNGTSQSYSMDRLQQGEYRWTVQAFVRNDRFGREGPIASNTMTIRELQHVRLEYPVEGRRYEGLTALNNPDSVRWSSAETVSSSRFILSANPNPLSNPQSIIADVQNPGRTIKLPSLREGTYYWTIIASSREGIDISAEKPLSFSVLPIPLLAAPKAVSPQDKHVFDIEELAAMSGFNFEWQPVAGANRYIFALYTRNASGALIPVIENQSLSRTSFSYDDLSGLLDMGSSFTWRVEAESRRNDGTTDRRGSSAEYTFMINLPGVSTIETRDPGILYGN